MVLTVTHSNNLKIYNLSSGRTVEEFLRKHKANLKHLRSNPDWESRVEFIQNFEFTTGSSKVEVSRDGNYIVAAGVYGPQIKIFEAAQMSLKVLRGVDSEVVDFTLLEDDYKKIALVCADRNIEIHARHGKHFKLRVPRPPRCLLYERYSADLLVGASSDEVYRLSLNEGRFQSSFSVGGTGISAFAYNQGLDLLICGGDSGKASLVDYKTGKVAISANLNDGEAITALKQAENNFEFFVGSSDGLVRLYDLRMNRHIIQKRSPYLSPIKSIEQIPNLNLFVSTDARSVRVHQKEGNGDLVCSYEQKATINSLCMYPNSGLLLLANDAPKIGALFVPALGPAPEFCQFLEHITEEFEEKTNTNVFEDQRFVTHDELVALNARSLIGTRQLTVHLNGFLMPTKLYDSLRRV